MAHKVLGAFLVFALISGAGGRTANALTENQTVTYTNAQLVANLKDAATGGGTLLKWTRPVQAALIGKNYHPDLEAFIRHHLADLALETRHPIGLYFSPLMKKQKRLPKNVKKIKFNLLILYLPRAEIPAAVQKRTGKAFTAEQVDKSLGNGPCQFQMRTKKSGEIRFAYLALVSEKKIKDVSACIVEMLSRAMGLPRSIKAEAETKFDGKTHRPYLTVHDRWMLRMLYGAGLKPGMTAAQAKPLLDAFLKEKRPQ